ncbi:hypothetical protein RirG_271230 [Rhizophagus irregularis DAOM 197198w]|uniref:Uncharacterized protein n=1 Tax=Rhizophagus irregularis (strain DAOM 197198w) TaxID=1432141 RepID=A0A015L6D7_RHIIW|nr:hypothetical protein RirG_271230 [Rhizophagus irregularis DAOM 197198w]
MTPQSFSFFLHVAMYSASQGFNAVYSGIKKRSEGRKQMLRLVRKHKEKSKKGKKAKKNKKKKHQSEDSDSDVLTDVSTSEIIRNTDDDDDQLGVDQDVIINRSIADASGSQSHVDQYIDMDILTVQPISELDVMPQPQLVKQPVDNSSNLTKSSNKKKKSNKNIIQQVITGHKPNDDDTSRIRNILVYDVPVSLTPEEILQQLTLWGKTISLQMKQQKKYQTVRLKIELTSFCLAQFKGNDGLIWTTNLGRIPVQ